MKLDPAPLAGLHHVTAICGDPQRNADFYAGTLGLRLVKRTVNFDDPGSYHLYYGDVVGSPGTLITFFAWTGLPPLADARGRSGAGQIAQASFRVPELGPWIDRFAGAGVDFDAPARRFDEEVLGFRDPDGLSLELVARPGPTRTPWEEGPVDPEHAVRGLEGVTLRLSRVDAALTRLLEALGMAPVGVEGLRRRFRLAPGAGGATLDLLAAPQDHPGRPGIGTIHHLALRTGSAEDQRVWRERLFEAGAEPTPVVDRQYFESIYFQIPGGVLFEIATDPPGFTVDESSTSLGGALRLPPWLESRRRVIEARLPVLRPPRVPREAVP